MQWKSTNQSAQSLETISVGSVRQATTADVHCYTFLFSLCRSWTLEPDSHRILLCGPNLCGIYANFICHAGGSRGGLCCNYLVMLEQPCIMTTRICDSTFTVANLCLLGRVFGNAFMEERLEHICNCISTFTQLQKCVAHLRKRVYGITFAIMRLR